MVYLHLYVAHLFNSLSLEERIFSDYSLVYVRNIVLLLFHELYFFALSGVAKGMISIQNSLDIWNNKLVISMKGAEGKKLRSLELY